MSAHIAVLGTNDNPLTGLFVEAMLGAGVLITALILDSRRPEPWVHAIHRERTGDLLPAVPLECFEENHIPSYLVTNHNSEACVALVRKLDVDVLVNAGTPRILSADLLAGPHLGVINCHPGLLPEFRGSSAVEWAIHNDQPVGNTIHLMSEGVDEGPVLWREVVSVAYGETYQTIRTRVHKAGFELTARAVAAIYSGDISVTDFYNQTGGKRYGPIDDDAMKSVHNKLKAGRYRSVA